MTIEKESSSPSLAMSILVWALMLMWVGLLIAPLFLPMVRERKEREYAGYQFKDDLVAEEMARYKRLAWTACILAWAATILFPLFGGL